MAEKEKKVFVSEIMTRKVITASKNDYVFESVKKMTNFTISTIVVVNGKKPVGIFTERDILNRIIADGKDPKKTRMKEVMTKELITADVNDTDIKVIYLMTQKKIKKVIITEKGRLAGIITQTDLLKFFGRKWLMK